MLLVKSRPSAGGRRLATSLGIKVMRPNGPEITSPQTIINWGCGRQGFIPYAERLRDYEVVNSPTSVSTAANKLSCLTTMDAWLVPVVPFSTSKQDVIRWLNHSQRDGEVVAVARTTLGGHSGEGIQLITSGENYGEGGARIPDAPLYTSYIKKSAEYRVHVFRDLVDVQIKRRKTDFPDQDVNYQVRNHQNGWVYCRENVDQPPGLGTLALEAVRSVGLDFGAVDIVWNRQRGMYVLEINTAPGIEGSTLEFYTNAIKRYYE